MSNRTGRQPHSVFDRFWRHTSVPADPDACWQWTGAVAGRGYGTLSNGNGGRRGVIYAHRLSWTIHSTLDVPNGFVVMHSCDNTRCVNPKHLSVATQRANVADMIAKGRHKANGKLSADEIRQIRERLASGRIMREVAREFGVSKSAINNVKRGTRWGWVK